MIRRFSCGCQKKIKKKLKNTIILVSNNYFSRNKDKNCANANSVGEFRRPRWPIIIYIRIIITISDVNGGDGVYGRGGVFLERVRLCKALIHISKVGHSLKKVRDVRPIGECGATLSNVGYIIGLLSRARARVCNSG